MMVASNRDSVIRMAPTAMLMAPAARVMARLRASFEAAALNGNARKMVRVAIESMVPMLKRAMYPRPVKVESIVGRRTTITAALPASP